VKDEAGFTLMETLCAIALILICTGAAAGLAYNTRRIAGTIREQSIQQYRRLRIEELIRETAENISVPYWERDEQGFPMACKAVEKTLLEAGFNAGVEFEALRNDAGQLRGIRCRCFIDGKEYEGSGLFASVPLAKEDR